MTSDDRDIPQLDLPVFSVSESGCGAYTGFNSVNLQEMYVVRKRQVVRSQIGRGWGKPIIVRLPGGHLLASQYKDLGSERNPEYPEAREEAALCLSTDDGLSWSSPRLLGIPGRVAQLSALRDGTLLLAAEALAGSPLYRSEDQGETWQRCRILWDQVEAVNGDRYFGETAGVVETPDGTLLCGFYVASPRPGVAGSYIIRSRDGGRTWADISCVGDGSEASFALLPDGSLLGVVRCGGVAGEGGASLKVTRSRDDGYSWSVPQRIAGLGMAQIPGFPLALRDGRVLLMYGNRQFPFGAQAVASTDNGKTWAIDRPIILTWFSWDNYCGHPRSILMPDDSVMTGYYARVFKEGSPNRDIVAHAVRWRVPDDWPEQRTVMPDIHNRREACVHSKL